MKAFVIVACNVPNEDIAEQLDLHCNALDQAKQTLRTMKNPCAYDKSNVHVVYEGEAFRALLLL